MKTITGDEDFSTPIIFLIAYSVALGTGLSTLLDNMNKVNSIVLSKPILFADSIITTISDISMFLFPVLIFFVALRQKHYLLKIALFLGTIPFIFSESVIIKLGCKSLFILNVVIIFIVVMLLIKYLIRTTNLYKTVLKQKIDSN